MMTSNASWRSFAKSVKALKRTITKVAEGREPSGFSVTGRLAPCRITYCNADSGSGLMESLDHLFQASASGVILRVYVQPKSRRAQIIGLHADRLKVAVTEPPDKGKANAAVVELVAETFAVAPSQVSLVRGETSRQKDALIQGLILAQATTTLQSVLGSNVAK